MTPAIERIGTGLAITAMAVFVVAAGAFIGALTAWLLAVLA